MGTRSSEQSVLRFGVFELDLEAGELRQAGTPIRLPPQPFKVLALLASRPGELVTRKEIQQQVWGSETFVDFEEGLNFCMGRIRTALHDHAAAPTYIQTLPGRGYRFIYPVEGQEPRQWWRRRWVAALAVVAVPGVVALVLGLNVSGLRDRLLGRPAPGEITSIAVLPLKNLSGDPEQEYFSDGMTEALLTELGKISALRVISRQSVMQYKDTEKQVADIARELSVGAVLEGSVLREGDRVRITVQLIQAEPERHLWAESYERNLTSALALQGEMARAIARQVRIAVTPEEEARLASTRPVDREAYEAYLKGRYFWNKRTSESTWKSLDYFQEAIEKDSSYAVAYAGLADSYNVLPYYTRIAPKEAYPKAKAASTKALQIDEMLAEAHTALAWVRLVYDWDWSGAEKEFQRALDLSPGYATAHHWYGIFLAWMGRYEQSIMELKRAQRLDPFSLVINSNVGYVFYAARQFDRAIEEYRKTLELDATFHSAHGFLGLAYLEKGIYEEAIAELEKAVALEGDNPVNAAKLGYAYAVAGKRREALRIVEEQKEERRQNYVPAYYIAAIYAGLGDNEQAISWLEKAYEERDSYLPWLKVDAIMDPLRSDPRFQSLLRRMNFPEN